MAKEIDEFAQAGFANIHSHHPKLCSEPGKTLELTAAAHFQNALA